MLVPFTPPLRGRHRRTRRKPSAPPGPTALMLVAATFSEVTTILRLTFNKPIDVSGMFPGNLTVNDGVSGTQWEGANPTLFNPSTVDVEMSEAQAQTYPDTRLNTVGPTGIVAVDDDEEWPGVSNLLLPFP